LSVRGVATVLVLLLATACANETVQEEPRPVRLTIGIHDVALNLPVGWQHLDHGLEHRFHRDLHQISIADIGPVTREGYLREINHARELFDNNQAEDARAHLGKIQLSSAFSTQRWKEISSSWYQAKDGGLRKKLTRFDVDVAYSTVLKEVRWLETPPLPTLVERVLPTLDSGVHREVAQRNPLEIDGLPGVRIETWDRLSHDHHQSYVFVLNQGNMLVVRMELGKSAEVQPAFDALVASLKFHATPPISP